MSVTLGQKFWSDMMIFRMELQNGSAISSKSNQLQNVNTERGESSNITTQPGQIFDRKSEVIAFVVNAGMEVTSNTKCIFYI